jgi:hypothetical protein
MIVRKLAIAGLAIAAGLAAMPASAKTARCVIRSEGGSYRGPCSYSVQRGGTFTVKPIGRRFLMPGVMMVTVFVDRDGYADVSGLTGAGVNSRWGQATRSRRDTACWVGDGFSVCAY